MHIIQKSYAWCIFELSPLEEGLSLSCTQKQSILELSLMSAGVQVVEYSGLWLLF